MGSRKVGLKSGTEARMHQKKPKLAQSTQSVHLPKIKFLIASGMGQQKLSRTVEAGLKDIKGTRIRFQTDSMTYDGIHLAYDDSPLLKNKLIVELTLPKMDRKIKALAEVVWFEKSFNDREEIYNVEAEFREMSGKDKEALEEYMVRLKK